METPELNEKLGRAVDALHQRIEQMGKEEKQRGGADPETKEAVEKIQDAIDRVEAENQEIRNQNRELELKIARMEQLKDAPGRDDEHTGDDPELVRLTQFYWKKGLDRMKPEDRVAFEAKALATDVGSDGGFVVYPTVDRRVREKLIEVSPILEIADVETIAGDAWEGPAEGDDNFEGGWVAERQERPETATGSLRKDVIPAEEIYANPRTTAKMLDDSGFDVEGWLLKRIDRIFSKKIGEAAVSGNGVGKMFGFLSASGVSEVKSGDATKITADGLLDLAYDLPEDYAREAIFALKRTTLREIRKLKQISDGAYVWQPGLANGQPSTILDKPFREFIDMPAIGAGTYPVVFAAWKRFYKVVDRQGMRVLRNPYKTPGYIEFYCTRRIGGKVVMAEAGRKLKIAA